MLFLNIQFFASKKAAGSTKNGRDSVGRRLGAKKSDGEFATAGSIIYRQRGTKVHPRSYDRRNDHVYHVAGGWRYSNVSHVRRGY